MTLGEMVRWIEEHVIDAKHIERALVFLREREKVKREQKKEGQNNVKTQRGDDI